MTAHVTRSHEPVGADGSPQGNPPFTLPIYQSAGWVFRSLSEVDAVYEGRTPGTIYGGSGVPNHAALEAKLSSLHGTESAIVTAAGMSAFAAVLWQLTYAGARVVAAGDLYGNTSRLLGDLNKFGVTTETVDACDLDQVTLALQQPTRLLVVETISNPRLRVADVRSLATIAHQRGALVVVDNTLASPYHCRPAEHGCDLVIESITKFLGGHHDIVSGCVTGSRALVEPLRLPAARAGLISAAFDSWLATRSIATLGVRLARSSATALTVAAWLERHPKVAAVRYPGLPSDASHAVARRTLSSGFGSVVSFELAPDRAAVDRLLAALTHVRLVLSFGGVATTLAHPATSSHRSLEPAQRAALGIHDGFLRLSVGLEDETEIVGDLERALAAI
jgi:cystathionine gamma-synthase/methionine-gamma-lyase